MQLTLEMIKCANAQLKPLCFSLRLNLTKASHCSILPPSKSPKVPLSFSSSSSSSKKLVRSSSSSAAQIRRWASSFLLPVRCRYTNSNSSCCDLKRLETTAFWCSLSFFLLSPFSLSLFSTRSAIIHWLFIIQRACCGCLGLKFFINHEL